MKGFANLPVDDVDVFNVHVDIELDFHVVFRVESLSGLGPADLGRHLGLRHNRR